ncbi:MAG: spore coat protein [Christensenellaceae bacterium]
MREKQLTTLAEQDSLQDMLDTEKHLMNLYLTAIIEASTRGLRKVLFDLLMGVNDAQLKVFEQMTERGYYQTQEADEELLRQRCREFEKRRATIR